MFQIYRAFSRELNKDSWSAGHYGHIVKVGHSRGGKKLKRIPSLNRGWRQWGECSAPLALKRDWRPIDSWTVWSEDEDIVANIEKEVRDYFFTVCGEFELFSALKDKMLEVHWNLNGLTEVVRADLVKVDADFHSRLGRMWRYEETRGLVEKVVSVIRVNDLEWKREMTKFAVQAL